MRSRRMLAPTFINALYIMIDGCHKDRMVVRVPFHTRTLHILIMTDLFFATYGELVILTKSWEMHDALSKVVVHILIELASNSA